MRLTYLHVEVYCVCLCVYIQSVNEVNVLCCDRVDLDKIPPVDCFKALLLVLDTLIEDEEVQV